MQRWIPWLVLVGCSSPAPTPPKPIGSATPDAAPHLDDATLIAQAEAALVALKFDEARELAGRIGGDPPPEAARVLRLRIEARVAGVPAEVVSGTPTPIDLPAVPELKLAPTSDGTQTPKALRVLGSALFEREITVSGTITWVYDCATAVRLPTETDKAVRARIDSDPTLCERPKFYVGDDETTPIERSLWVVDVPRPFNALERRMLPKDELAHPDAMHCLDPACPQPRVGDKVQITGKLARSSPHNETNSDGLLVYGSMVDGAFRSPSFAVTKSPPLVTATTTPPPKFVPGPAPITPITEDDTHAAKRLMNECTKALGSKQFDTAIELCKQAIAKWPDHPLAHYGLGGAYAQRGEWPLARDAFAQAAHFAPQVAMHQMWFGIAAYESGDQPLALVHLAEAVRLDDRIWRAHYYLGKLARAANAPRDAATEFGKAMRARPLEAAPYIALAELYRTWDLPDLALLVAKQGAANVPGAVEESELYFVIGLAYDDKHQDKEAVEAYTEALDRKRDNAKALFQRGQAYFRRADFANAKLDLESYLKFGIDGFTKGQANRMLMDLAAKTAGASRKR